MPSALTSAAQAAHSLATSILGRSQVQPGETIPVGNLKESAADETISLDLTGRNLIIGVTGAFTGTCSAQIPAYINAYDEIKAKGINNIYVVSVNDVFAMKAWKEKLAPEGTEVRFLADDKGVFTGSLGLLFDASARLGTPRSKRYVIIADDGKVTSIAVEEVSRNLTVTDVRIILAQL